MPVKARTSSSVHASPGAEPRPKLCQALVALHNFPALGGWAEVVSGLGKVMGRAKVWEPLVSGSQAEVPGCWG